MEGGRDRVRAPHDGIAVGLLLREIHVADRATGAGLVQDGNRDAEHLGHAVGQHPRGLRGRAGGAEQGRHLDRLAGRIVNRLGFGLWRLFGFRRLLDQPRRRHHCERGGRENDASGVKVHFSPPLSSLWSPACLRPRKSPHPCTETSRGATRLSLDCLGVPRATVGRTCPHADGTAAHVHDGRNGRNDGTPQSHTLMAGIRKHYSAASRRAATPRAFTTTLMASSTRSLA